MNSKAFGMWASGFVSAGALVNFLMGNILWGVILLALAVLNGWIALK